MKKEDTQFLNDIGLLDHLVDGKIAIPSNCTSVRIDVGLAGDAPNSALWLLEDPNVFVIGIEPLEYHHEHLYELGRPDNNTGMRHPVWPIIQLKDKCVSLNRKHVLNIQDRFLLLKTAISNTIIPGKQTFYLNKKGETGSSSLKKSQAFKRPHLIDKTIDVNVCSLQYILDFLPMEKFNFIVQIKTDNEGSDLETIKSAGNNIRNVIFVNSETVHLDFKEKSEFIMHMKVNKFELYAETVSEMYFVNKNYNKTISEKNLKSIQTGI